MFPATRSLGSSSSTKKRQLVDEGRRDLDSQIKEEDTEIIDAICEDDEIGDNLEAEKLDASNFKRTNFAVSQSHDSTAEGKTGFLSTGVARTCIASPCCLVKLYDEPEGGLGGVVKVEPVILGP